MTGKQSLSEQISGIGQAYSKLSRLPKKDLIGREAEHKYVLQSLLAASNSLAFIKEHDAAFREYIKGKGAA